MTGERGKFVARCSRDGRTRSTTRKIIFQKSHDHLLFLISFRPTLQVPSIISSPSPPPFGARIHFPRLVLAILRYQPTANTESGIMACAHANRRKRNADWGSGSSFQSARRSILIRKPKTIPASRDNMPRHRESARVRAIDAWTLFVESLETLRLHRETTTSGEVRSHINPLANGSLFKATENDERHTRISKAGSFNKFSIVLFNMSSRRWKDAHCLCTTDV